MVARCPGARKDNSSRIASLKKLLANSARGPESLSKRREILTVCLVATYGNLNTQRLRKYLRCLASYTVCNSGLRFLERNGIPTYFHKIRF